MRALLLCLTPHWDSSARLPRLLAAGGFRVGAVCPEGALLTLSRHVAAPTTFRSGDATSEVARLVREAIEAEETALIVPTDDTARELMHYWHAQGAGRHGEALISLIEASLGDPAHYAALERKSALPDLAARAGVRMPASELAPTFADAEAFAARHGWPVVTKPDHGSAGWGVAVCVTPEDLRRAYARLPPHDFGLRRQPITVSAQRFVRGREASVAVAALRGDLVGAVAVEKELTFPNRFGPTSVARRLDRPDLLDAAARLVRAVGLTGFGGVDFMIEDGTDDAYLLELNPRPPGNLSVGVPFGVPVAALLRAALAGEAPPAPTPPAHERVALFPAEWRRDPSSRFLKEVFHDVPWDEPRLIALYLAGIGPAPTDAHPTDAAPPSSGAGER